MFDEFAVVGDTLFNNGIGRTDLYKGDYETLVDSIQDKIFELEGDLPLFLDMVHIRRLMMNN